MKASHPLPALDTSSLHPGMRIAAACSGGADSVALLRALLDRRDELGLVLSVAHMNHGIRGEESDADAAFVEALAASFDLPFHLRRVDTPATARTQAQGLEETARALRYAWFRQLLADGEADAVATAHTRDDQAETVLHRLLRGAWTEGLGGIYPALDAEPKTAPRGAKPRILRPFLNATRAEIETYLRRIGQPWREDSSNQDPAYTRNRLRRDLLPKLAEYNPAIQTQLAHLATLARDDEAYWQQELARLMPSLLLPGKAVRGGGRATDTLRANDSLAVEIERLRALHPALRRRVLRAAAAQLGASLDFAETDRLLGLCGLLEPATGNKRPANLKLQLEKGLRAERTPRELRLFRAANPETAPEAAPETEQTTPEPTAPEYKVTIPGAVDAEAFGLRLEVTLKTLPERPPQAYLPEARLRSPRPGDRIVLRHSRSRLKIGEALRRSRLPAATACPVLEWQNEIVWVQGLPIESELARNFALAIRATPLPPPN